MARASVMLCMFAAAALAGFGQAQAGPAASPALGFKDATLGMSLDAWRRAPFPGSANPRVAPTCTAAGGASSSGLTAASAPSGPATEVCAYVSRYGATTLTEDVPWTANLLVKSPRYVFTDGRLSRIDLHVSIDTFDKIMARMKARFGAPRRLVHDVIKTRVGAVPRVTVRWTAGSSVVELVDPSPDLASMTLSFIAGPPAAKSPASAG